jgi:hypothetical protein
MAPRLPFMHNNTFSWISETELLNNFYVNYSMSSLDPLLEYLYQVGTFLVMDDIKDYGKLDRFHHWQYGELLRYGTILLGLLETLRGEGEEDLDKPEEVIKEVKEWLDSL